MTHKTGFLRDAHKKFSSQKGGAKYRGIGWELSFDQWMAIWSESGKFDQRGNKKGCYCMARHLDQGPYAVGNVSIILSTENVREAYVNKPGACGGHALAGRGRGWTVIARAKNPYVVFCKSKYVGVFPNQNAAEAAYKKALAA